MSPFDIQSKAVFISFILSLCCCACSVQHEESKSTAASSTDSSVVKESPIAKDSSMKPFGFENYCNSRYHYCIDYPSTMTAQPEATNGDGRVFLNLKDSASLTVYGTIGIDLETELPVSIKLRYELDIQNIKDESPNNRITYHKLGKNFFVLSGYKKDRIFYQKTIVEQDDLSQNPSFAYAILEYRDQDKEVYNKISEKVFTSFE